MKGYRFLFLFLLGWSLNGCKNPAPKASVSVDEASPISDTLLLSGHKSVIRWGERRLPKEIFLLDEKHKRKGYAFEYEEHGGLSSVSHWENGVKEGNTFIFQKGQKTHQLFDQGRIIYEGDYRDQIKISNRLYPQVVEEFFFEDKYYAKLRFPLAYSGQLTLQVKNYQAVISPLPDQTFQVVINDALDLTEYHLLLTYQPAVQDSLGAAEYGFSHVVYGE